MIRTIIGRVDRQDLARWREMMARKDAVETSSVSTIEDCERAYLAHFRLAGEMVEKYEIDDLEDWNISVFTGDLYYYYED